MMKWYVMQVFNNHENIVKTAIEHDVNRKNMNHLLGRIVAPKEKYLQLRNGKKVKTERSYFPGYMMIECDLTRDMINLINNVNGVVGFLGGKIPTPMKDYEVKNMMEKMDELTESNETLSTALQVGQKVKIVDGPFASMNGVITSVLTEKQRVMVDMSIFNRITALELTYDQIVVE